MPAAGEEDPPHNASDIASECDRTIPDGVGHSTTESPEVVLVHRTATKSPTLDPPVAENGFGVLEGDATNAMDDTDELMSGNTNDMGVDEEPLSTPLRQQIAVNGSAIPTSLAPPSSPRMPHDEREISDVITISSSDEDPPCGPRRRRRGALAESGSDSGRDGGSQRKRRRAFRVESGSESNSVDWSGNTGVESDGDGAPYPSSNQDELERSSGGGEDDDETLVEDLPSETLIQALTDDEREHLYVSPTNGDPRSLTCPPLTPYWNVGRRAWRLAQP